jgi:hypothetical protein
MDIGSQIRALNKEHWIVWMPFWSTATQPDREAKMKKTSRYPLIFLLVGLLVFLGLVFQQALLAYLVLPIATVVWLLLRIFVLSVDQQAFWALLIVVIVLMTVLRLLGRPEWIEQSHVPVSNPVLNRASSWQDSILANIHYTGESNTAKQNLISLLASIKSSRQPGAGEYETRKALKRRQVDLPEPIYAFLFADEPVPPAQSFFAHPAAVVQRKLESVRMAPRKWIRRMSGRETAEYYQAIDQVLTLMEISLEMKHDDKHIDVPNH